MTVLALRLVAPLQSWGSSSRFTTRSTDDAPTKSGILGLLAASKGLRRSDSLEDLLSLKLAVRIDQPGQILRDFQTAHSLDQTQVMPLSYRYYRSDARYLVGLQGEQSLLEGLVESLTAPTFPLYLGRRSCPPAEPLVPRLVAGDLSDLLLDASWIASQRWQMSRRTTRSLEFRIDEGDYGRSLGTTERDEARDVPLSFAPENRQYTWRRILRGWVPIPGQGGSEGTTPLLHDPMQVVM